MPPVLRRVSSFIRSRPVAMTWAESTTTSVGSGSYRRQASGLPFITPGNAKSLEIGKPVTNQRKNKTSLQWLDLPNSNLELSDVMNQAREALCCVDWDEGMPNVFLESTAADALEPRLLEKGEFIDFFVSHSWHDTPESKWQVLTSHFMKFKAKYKRSPTFWFDKACIPQDKITEGIRNLPVNVMSCRKFLVLLGDTYVTRLWCIWELFTLFTLLPSEVAMVSVKVLPVGVANLPPSVGVGVGVGVGAMAASAAERNKKAGLSAVALEDALRSLEEFNLESSKCFDPNEERRIRVVVHMAGGEVFEHRIRDLGRQMREAVSGKPARPRVKTGGGGGGSGPATSYNTSTSSTSTRAEPKSKKGNAHATLNSI